MQLLWAVFVATVLLLSSDDDSIVDEIFNILDQGDKEIDFGNETDFIVVLGLSGSGKSTLVHYISGDPDTLVGVMKNGDLIYNDTVGKISDSNTVSKTLFPEMTIDGESGEAVIDCPGFDDTRNASFEIASSYFINGVFKRSKTLKLILTVPKNAFTAGERFPLDALLNNFIKLVKDIDKYAASIGLVVTKMPIRQYNDSEEIRFIKSSLGEAKDEYNAKLKQSSDEDEKMMILKKIKVIDAWLDESVDKISVFRYPEQAGPISQSEYSMNNRMNIRVLVFKYIIFLPSGNDDFDFPLTASSENFIRDRIYPEIDGKISKSLNGLTSELVDRVNVLGESSDSILNFETNIQQIYELLYSVDLKNVTMTQFQNLVHSCVKYVNKAVNSRLDQNEFTKLVQQFEFFRSFTDKIDDPYTKWTELFSSPRELTKFLKTLYMVFNNVFETVGTAAVQKTKNTHFDKDLLNITYSVTDSSAKDFLIKIKSSKITTLVDEINDLIYNNVTDFEKFIIRDMNIILTLIRPNVTCSNGILLIQSTVASVTSDVLSRINDCQNMTTISIMAYDKLFFDSDVFLHETDVSIIVDKLIFDHIVKLDLSGSPGLELSNLPNSDGNGSVSGSMGSPGLPGGNVFISVKEIQNSNYFSVYSNGGTGGKGQDGSDGQFVDYNNTIPDYNEFDNGDGFSQYFIDKSYSCKKIREFHPNASFSGKIYVYVGNDTFLLNQQLAGDGGKSGYGGHAGKISLINPNTTLNISQSLIEGHIGSVGIGGKGWHLQGVEFNCWYKLIDVTTWYQCYVTNRSPKVTYFGIDGKSDFNETKPQNRPSTLNNVNDIIMFKLNVLQTTFLTDIATGLSRFTTDKNVLVLYDTHALVTEILEVEYAKNNILPSTLDTYLRNMISAVKTWPTSDNDDVQLTTFLISTISTMIWNLQVSNDTVFITDLYSYVNNAMTSIEELDELGVIKATENIKEAYSKSMDQNILEAQNYITQFVTKEFKDALDGIRTAMSDLVLEIRQLEEAINQQIEVLKEKEEQLKKNMIAHAIFGVINVAGAVLSLLGPVGTAASVALGAASSITESLVVGNVNVNGMNPIGLPDGVHNLLSDLKALQQSRREGHMEVLIFTCDKYLNTTEITDKEKSEVIEIKKQAMTIPNITKISDVDKIVQNSIKALEGIFKDLNIKDHPELAALLNNTLEILDYAKTASKIAGPILDAMKNLGDDQAKLQVVVRMIEEDKKSLQDLSDFEDGIYEAIDPLLDTLQKDMSSLEDELRNKSSVSLLVKRWEINKYIATISDTISRYTEGFQVQKEFLKYFNQLSEAANLVITLFDQIQYYQEHKQFSEYIGNLQMVGGGDIPSDSPNLKELVALKTSIVSGLVRSHCYTIISSFKQQVFPFADIHLGSLGFQDGGYCDGPDVSVINTIKTVKNELSNIRDTINNNQDIYVHTGIFDSKYVSTHPFAVWDNNTYGIDINKLFKGEEIVLMAPVIGLKNAVKFNKIQIKFKRTDGGPQEDLDNALKLFNLEQTHFGNSLYKCDSFTFIIRSEPLTLSYALEMDDTGKPVTSNEVYNKLIKGDISLSPYTMWRLKLTETYRKEGGFGALDNFTKANVNLELCGTGQFVDKDVSVCKGGLIQYYEAYNPMILT